MAAARSARPLSAVPRLRGPAARLAAPRPRLELLNSPGLAPPSGRGLWRGPAFVASSLVPGPGGRGFARCPRRPAAPTWGRGGGLGTEEQAARAPAPGPHVHAPPRPSRIAPRGQPGGAGTWACPAPPRPGGPEGEKPRRASAGPKLQVWPAEGRALSALTAIPGQGLWAQSSRGGRRSFPAGHFPSPSRLPPLGLAQAGSQDWWTSALHPKQPLLIKPRKGLAS